MHSYLSRPYRTCSVLSGKPEETIVLSEDELTDAERAQINAIKERARARQQDEKPQFVQKNELKEMVCTLADILRHAYCSRTSCHANMKTEIHSVYACTTCLSHPVQPLYACLLQLEAAVGGLASTLDKRLQRIEQQSTECRSRIALLEYAFCMCTLVSCPVYKCDLATGRLRTSLRRHRGEYAVLSLSQRTTSVVRVRSIAAHTKPPRAARVASVHLRNAPGVRVRIVVRPHALRSRSRTTTISK